ncbi:MAG: hypothetical protein CBARDMAM_2824 [uncultured Caballeronia sp.]|nr:MAG: hypothetical protein CBARDMAM_2824 [uncultured Caballeronia sp.]
MPDRDLAIATENAVSSKADACFLDPAPRSFLALQILYRYPDSSSTNGALASPTFPLPTAGIVVRGDDQLSLICTADRRLLGLPTLWRHMEALKRSPGNDGAGLPWQASQNSCQALSCSRDGTAVSESR